MHETKIRVQYYDTDRMGVVHHSNYIRYFETGRTEFIRACGIPYARIEAEGVLMPVISVECRCFLPACYDEVLTVRTKISGEITARICFAYEIYNESAQLVCTGSTTLAFIDAATRRPVRPPEAISQFLMLHS
ncbi:MAG: acyl-CoA thioesterase [Prevotellaceae bacterium]|jgi:acyl-CoA thioester hydrolase|nr:acyl-CoA thioesterase [Prevotellaceae bacterium]